MRKRKIKIPSKFWKPLKYKIEFDWELYRELEMWRLLKYLLEKKI